MELGGSVGDWIGRRQRMRGYSVTRTPLSEMDGWYFRPDDGDLVHRSGGFFEVQGIEVSIEGRPSWTQPIIRQDEIGILGILTTEFDGVPHFLLQAKMEPGNVGPLQVSPTVQATRSNYTRVHRGASVPYLEYFLEPEEGRVVFDALQSEQGSWFWGKRNRNVVVSTANDVPVKDGFRWFSLDEMAEAIRVDNLINMDTRTALSGLARLPGAEHHPRHPTSHVLSRFTAAKAGRRFTRRRLPLRSVRDWTVGGDRIARADGRFFEIIGVAVEAGDREVARWSQPMLAPAGTGVVAFAARRFGAELHVLMELRSDAGTFDLVELGPTVMCLPSNYETPSSDPVTGGPPPYLEAVLGAPPERRLVDVVHSEEGGRFYHARNRYLVVEMDDGFAERPGGGHVWVSLGQLAAFVRYGNVVDVGARCLLTCLMLAGHHPVVEPGR
ncbi:NDP-hexose 2,3-dehydratase family protein [Actinomadura chibensis]|nr:NDP-hexose 2,3-dehydratase family protein [Actinomadura chibensis]